MLKHCVFLSLRSPADMAAIDEAMDLLQGLVDKIDGMTGFACGPNRDFENKSADYPFGFVVDFTNREAHLAYERHDDHLKAGALLVAACRGGHGGIFVADLDCG